MKSDAGFLLAVARFAHGTLYPCAEKHTGFPRGFLAALIYFIRDRYIDLAHTVSMRTIRGGCQIVDIT
jgi:hypothetical protein